jgi:hypothetical protein
MAFGCAKAVPIQQRTTCFVITKFLNGGSDNEKRAGWMAENTRFVCLANTAEGAGGLPRRAKIHLQF